MDRIVCRRTRCARGRPRSRLAALTVAVTLTALAAALLAPTARADRHRSAPLRAPTVSQIKARHYVVMAVNDLGMHCFQKSYAGFMILPPANFLKVQIFRRGGEGAHLVTRGVKVSYSVIDNTRSANKTDFWTYAKFYGWPNLKPNVGITGKKLTGTMKYSPAQKAWVADAVPLTPYNDKLVFNPLQLGKIVVRSAKTGKVVARQPRFVIPVSDEMRCDYCHGPQDTAGSILQAHDDANGTHLHADLVAGTPHACAECHADNALGKPGVSGVESLSQAMHSFHADKMSAVSVSPDCYACHPGAVTRCLRGAMARQGFTCTNARCHGDMAQVGNSQAAPPAGSGRQAWLQEPRCGGCHGAKFSENAGTLYRMSFLKNGPEGMNGAIRCESCHGSPHAEWPSTNARDNYEPVYNQGLATFIKRCVTCHGGESGGIHGNTGG